MKWNTLINLLMATILASAAANIYAVPYEITSRLTGDLREENPDNLIVDVTITGDTDSSTARWLIDLSANAGQHDHVKLDEFYFNLNDAANSFTFSNFDPSTWQINTPASVQGAGGAGFLFELINGSNNSNRVGLCNNCSQSSIAFDMTYSLGNLDPDIFLSAPTSNSNDAGSGQLGAHLQSLTFVQKVDDDSDNENSASGFAFGNLDGGVTTTSVPEPNILALLGLGLAGIRLTRRKIKTD